MSVAENLEIWKNVLFSLIPYIIFLVAAIMIIKKVRNGYTILLVIAAALVILLPVISSSIVLGRQALINDGKNIIATINAMPTQQEKEAAAQRETPRIQQIEAQVKQKDIYLAWLKDGQFISLLVFGAMLVVAVGMFEPKAAPATPSQSLPPDRPIE